MKAKIPAGQRRGKIFIILRLSFYSDTEYQHSHTGNNIHCHTHFQSCNVGDDTDDPWHQDAAEAGGREQTPMLATLVIFRHRQRQWGYASHGKCKGEKSRRIAAT